MKSKLFLSSTILLALVLVGCNSKKPTSSATSESPIISSSEVGPVVPDPEVIPDSLKTLNKSSLIQILEHQ